MKIEVIKIAETPKSTLSKMMIDGLFFCFVIEDGYKKIKVPGETRIPDGTYRIGSRTYGKFWTKYKKTTTFIPQLFDVPGFLDILIHPGNTIKDTRGCILPNMECGFDAVNQVFYGKNSTLIFYALCAQIRNAWDRGETVTITMQRDEKSNN